MKKPSATRIAIIGAGAAGLMAAETLKQKGYTQITIFERDSRAGGKCFSITHEGRSYELGAGIVASNNQTVLQLAKRFGVKVAPVDFGKSVLLDVKTGQPLPKKNWLKKLTLLYQLFFRYHRLTRTYQPAAQPGFAQVNPELCLPFSAWAKKHKVELVAQELASFFTGFGYGYFDEIPAAYVLKYYSWETVKAFLNRDIYKFPDGIQHLWSTVAQQQQVLYDASIKKIQRAASVQITFEQKNLSTKTLEFDELILTSPLDESPFFLDVTEQEQHLFSKIIYCDYRTFACWLKDFPQTSGYVPGNYTSSRAGHPVFWYQRYRDSNLYTFYVLGDWKITNEQILKNIERVVQQLGGSIERVHTTAQWKYFPHVTPEKMRDGFYDQLESLQGQKHTYLAGESLNFSTVGLSSAYAEQLVERFF